LESCGSVLIVDDDAGFRGLISTLLIRAGLAVEEASGGEEALRAVRARRPEVVLLDVFLPDISGYEVCRELKEEFGDDLPVVFISGERTESGDRVAGLLVGADDYLSKSIDPSELLARMLRFVPVTRRRGARRNGRATELHGDLTRRELQVLQLLAEGRRSSDIAEELVISPKTVASHIQGILAKLQVSSQAQAVAVAYRDDLIELPDGRTRPMRARRSTGV
jgi:DNA-binding NarL/FixJ family response regulator